MNTQIICYFNNINIISLARQLHFIDILDAESAHVGRL